MGGFYTWCIKDLDTLLGNTCFVLREGTEAQSRNITPVERSCMQRKSKKSLKQRPMSANTLVNHLTQKVKTKIGECNGAIYMKVWFKHGITA